MIKKICYQIKKNIFIRNYLFAICLSTPIFAIFWNVIYGDGYLFTNCYIKACTQAILINFLISFIIFLFFLSFNESKNIFLNIFGITIFLLIIYLLACNIRVMLQFHYQKFFLDENFYKLIFGISGMFLIFFLIKRRLFFSFTRKLFLIFIPYVLIFHFFLFKEIVVNSFNKDTPLTKNDAPRVLLLIYDELDQYLAFSNRPSYLELNEFDTFQNESFYSQKANSPAPWTLSSLPSYISGLYLSAVYVHSHNQLLFHLKDQNKIIFNKKSDNLFSKIAKLNLNSALIGWYHPYNRLINSVNHCYVCESKFSSRRIFNRILERLINHNLAFLKPNFKINLKNKNPIHPYTHVYNDMMKEIIECACNKDYNFIFCHLIIPHSPSIYSLNEKKLSTAEKSYFSNVKLSDLILKEIKEEMQKNDLWDSTTVIVTSDHPFRFWHDDNYKSFKDKELIEFKANPPEPLVPCMIKLANNSQKYKFDKNFNTLILHNLILEILQKKINSLEDLVSYMDLHCNDFVK